MKKNQRYILPLLAFVTLVLGVFPWGAPLFANGGAEQASSVSFTPPGTFPIVNEPLTLSYWVENRASDMIATFADNEVYKAKAEATGITIEFLHPPVGQAKEQFNLMIASMDLPDMIEGWTDGYPGGPEKAVSEEVYLNLADYLNDYAPNYQRLRHSNPEIAKQSGTDSGVIWAFYLLQEEVAPSWYGPLIRKDWLEDLGLAVPETIDEWYTMLSLFKEQKGATAPLIHHKSGIDGNGLLVSAYDIGPGFFQKDGKVMYGPAQPAFKEYLRTMRQWYAEGLIDSDFPSRDNKGKQALMINNETGVYPAGWGEIAKYNTLMKDDNPRFGLVPARYPSLIKGEMVRYRQQNWYNKGYPTVVTGECEYPEAAIRWMDFNYTEEGFYLLNYGIEGVSYNMVDGAPQFSDFMLNNPDGIPYSKLSNVWKIHGGPYWRTWVATPIDDEVRHAQDVWTNQAGGEYVIPSLSLLSFTVEEGKKHASVMNEVKTYVEQMSLKFIMGVSPLEEFDTYIDQIEKMNIALAIECYQAALDRYNNR